MKTWFWFISMCFYWKLLAVNHRLVRDHNSFAVYSQNELKHLKNAVDGSIFRVWELCFHVWANKLWICMQFYDMKSEWTFGALISTKIREKNEEFLKFEQFFLLHENSVHSFISYVSVSRSAILKTFFFILNAFDLQFNYFQAYQRIWDLLNASNHRIYLSNPLIRFLSRPSNKKLLSRYHSVAMRI